MRKSRARPSFTMASPAPAISIHATRRPVRLSCPPCAKNIAQFTGILTINPDGSLFCDSLRTDRTLDLRDRTYFKQALVARDTVTLEPVFGRLTGISVLQIAYPVRSGIRGAEIHPARLVQSAEVRRVSRQAPVGRNRDPAGRQEGHRPRCARGKGLDRTGRRDRSRTRSYSALQPNWTAEPLREVTDRDGRTQVWAVARSPFGPRCRALYPGWTIQGQSARRRQHAACTRTWRYLQWPRCCCWRASGCWPP